jgi:hypothetical protein
MHTRVKERHLPRVFAARRKVWQLPCLVWGELDVCIVIAGVVNLCSPLLGTGSRASGRHASILLPQFHHPTVSDPDPPITIMTSPCFFV